MSLSLIFGVAVFAVLILSLVVEHLDSRRGADLPFAATLVVLAYVASNVLVDLLGKDEALRWFCLIDLAGTAAGAWLYRRKPESWRAVLTLAYFAMCWVHVAFWCLPGVRGPEARYGLIATLNIGTWITVAAVAFPGGRYVAQAVGRALSARLRLGGVARSTVHRGKPR